MVITEEIKLNGKDFRKTYSDEGFMIERDGIRYSEAIDPIEFTDRIYTETDQKIESPEERPESIED